MFLKGDDELLFNDVIVDVDDELYSIMRNENNENNEESDYYISDYEHLINSTYHVIYLNFARNYLKWKVLKFHEHI